MARVAARDLQLWQQLTIVQRWVARDLDRILREALGVVGHDIASDAEPREPGARSRGLCAREALRTF